MKRLIRLVAIAAVVAAITALAAFAAQRFARSHGRLRGLLYRLFGRRPDPEVDDLTLADRVRSELGPLEKRLDVPHVHVMVEDHVVLLHGEVEWPHEAASIEEAARRVSGVRDVESHLRTGALPSNLRPSAGRRRRVISAS
jgi:hypothetical protein